MSRKIYAAPLTEVINVRPEGNILNASYNADRNQKPVDTGDVDF